MNTVTLTDELRRKINDFLSVNYGLLIPDDEGVICTDRQDYIYMDTDCGNFIHIPKEKIN